GGTNILNFTAYSTTVGVTLTGSNAFGYSGTTSGSPNPTGGFAEITQIDTTANSNTLTLANGIASTVTINSSLPVNLFNLTVNVSGAPDLVFTGISIVNGGTGVTNTLISGESTNNIWTLTSLNGGTYYDGQLLTFSNFGNLIGGSGSDVFGGTSGGISGTLNGGAGINSLNYSGYAGTVLVNLADDSATGIYGGAAGGFSNIQVLTGNGANTTLTGPGGINAWHITGLNTGDINNPSNFSFAQVWNLTGGGSQDTYIFSDGQGVQGTLTGGTDGILDYHLYTSAVTVNLGNNTATGTGGISGIHGLIGANSGSNLTTLISGSGSNIWDITGTNAGDLNGPGNFSFTQVQNLTGGSGADSFTLSGTGNIGGLISGGGGSDTLIGNNLTNAWAITGSNSGTLTDSNGTNNFSGIANLTGGTGNDSFTLSGTGNIGGLIGGGGG
ncbi:MAG: hypothetical protein ACRETA_14160, partial [Gammaproteobacteria bacterium]